MFVVLKIRFLCMYFFKNSNHKRKAEEKNVKNRATQYNNEWENIEKHLSMKKTIRKKMMRDLQQAFIDGQDPQQWNSVQIAAHKGHNEPNLLEMLKDNGVHTVSKSPPSNPCSTNVQELAKPEPTSPTKKPGFWKKLTMRKSKR